MSGKPEGWTVAGSQRPRKPEPRGVVAFVAPDLCYQGNKPIQNRPYDGDTYEAKLCPGPRKCKCFDVTGCHMPNRQIDRDAVMVVVTSTRHVDKRPQTEAYHVCCVAPRQVEECVRRYAAADVVHLDHLARAPLVDLADGRTVPRQSVPAGTLLADGSEMPAKKHATAEYTPAEFKQLQETGGRDFRPREAVVVDFGGEGKYFYVAFLDRREGVGWALAYDKKSQERRVKFAARAILGERCATLPRQTRERVVEALWLRMKARPVPEHLRKRLDVAVDKEEGAALGCTAKGPKAPKAKKGPVGPCVKCGAMGHRTPRARACKFFKEKEPELTKLDVKQVQQVGAMDAPARFDARAAAKALGMRIKPKPERRCTCGLIPCLCDDGADESPYGAPPPAPAPAPPPAPPPLAKEVTAPKAGGIKFDEDEDEDEPAGEDTADYDDEDEEDVESEDEEDRAFINDGDEFEDAPPPPRRPKREKADPDADVPVLWEDEVEVVAPPPKKPKRVIEVDDEDY